jgi:hypothetical protein
MMNFHDLTKRAVIGAAIGGSLVCLIVVSMAEARFLFETLMVLGSGGLIGGALCGIIFGALNKRAGVIIGGFVGGIAGCVLATVGTLFYAATPWPSPRPYPGAETHIELGGGSWGPSRVQTYVTTLPLDTVQHHYEDQMNQYCVDDWQFEGLSDTEYQLCRQADCQIFRLGLEQYFRVHLCSVSETQTMITHIDAWQD